MTQDAFMSIILIIKLLGLFRASHFHNPLSIRIPVGLLPHFILIERRVINSISHRHAPKGTSCASWHVVGDEL